MAAPISAVIAAAGYAPDVMNVISRYRFKNGAYARHVAVFTDDGVSSKESALRRR